MRAATAHATPWWMNSRPCAPFNGESRKLSPLAGDAAPPGSAGEPTLNCRDEGVRAPLVAVRHVRWGNSLGVAREKFRFPIDRKKPTEVSPQALQSTERPRRNVALILHRPTEEAYETTSGIRHRCIRPDGRGRGGRGASRPRPALRL